MVLHPPFVIAEISRPVTSECLGSASSTNFWAKIFPEAAQPGDVVTAAQPTTPTSTTDTTVDRTAFFLTSPPRRAVRPPRRRRCSVSRPHCPNLADGLHF